MPRRKIDHTEERRMTLGEYERQLEQDKIMVQGGQAVAQAVAGITQGIGGLGVGGGILLAGLIWGKDLKELKDNIVEMFPEGGAFLSPEWIASWGDNPTEILGESLAEGDNDAVDSLPPIETPHGQFTLEGKTPYEVYSLACAGRAAHYDWEKANILQNYIAKYGPLMGYAPAQTKDEAEAEIIANWHKYNKQPAMMLTFDQCAVQNAIRITCARIDLTTWTKYFQERNPSKKPGFVKDPLLDWLAYTDDLGHSFFIEGILENNVMDVASPNPYNYSKRRAKGERQIALYAYWQPPISAP